MARFDVYRARSGALMLDCQADFLSGIETRLIAPLLPVERSEPRLPRLNPTFDLNGEHMVMMTTLLVSIPITDLGKRVGSLANEQDAIKNAIDLLLSGF